MNSLRMVFECMVEQNGWSPSFSLVLGVGLRQAGSLDANGLANFRGDFPCFLLLLLLMSVAACRRPFGLPPRRSRVEPSNI